MSDPVTAPAHYEGSGVERKDAMKSMMHGADVEPSQAYWWGCAFKYVWRWPRKNGAEDIRKAITCLELLLGSLEDKEVKR